MSNYHVAAVSHIDLGFTMSKAELSELLEILLVRVFDALQQNPKIHFAIEQMAHYRELEKRRPELIEKLKGYIVEGRIEVMGAMASSLETNFPNGECFVRNQQIGLRFAKEHLNAVPDTAWLIDTFGMNAQISQIYKQFGFDSVQANRFGGMARYDMFNAVGIDGSKILVMGRDCASINIIPNSQAFKLCRSRGDIEALFKQADSLTGETPRLVVYYLENEEQYSLYYIDLADSRNGRNENSWKISSYKGYMDSLRKYIAENNPSIPDISGDLNPEFTGTFSLRYPLRVKNREVETSLLEAEKWTTLLNPEFDYSLFEESWWDLAFNQFHDVFSGSHGDDTYAYVMSLFEKAGIQAETAVNTSVDKIAKQGSSIVCINGLPFERTEWLKIDNPQGKDIQVCHAGQKLQAVTLNGSTYFKATLPPVGIIQLDVEKAEQAIPDNHVEENRKYIKNEFMTLELDELIGIKKLTLADGSIVMENASDFLTVEQDIGGFQIENPVGNELMAIGHGAEISKVTKNIVGESITISGECPQMSWNGGKNTLAWSIAFSLVSGENAIKTHITLNWNGEGTRIRFKVPTVINAYEGIYEIPFGVVSRKEYDDRPTAKGEWPAHRFAAIDDENIGVALINRGNAGVEKTGGTLSTTLIRAYNSGPMAWVSPTALTSCHGKNEYDFMLVPYKGKANRVDILPKAQEFNNSIQIFENRNLVDENCLSFLSIDKNNIILSAVKQKHNDKNLMVIRYYETLGIETKAVLHLKGVKNAYLSDVKEEKGKAISYSNNQIEIHCKPFEIQTILVDIE